MIMLPKAATKKFFGDAQNKQFQANTEQEDTMLQDAAMMEHFGARLTEQFRGTMLQMAAMKKHFRASVTEQFRGTML